MGVLSLGPWSGVGVAPWLGRAAPRARPGAATGKKGAAPLCAAPLCAPPLCAPPLCAGAAGVAPDAGTDAGTEAGPGAGRLAKAARRRRVPVSRRMRMRVCEASVRRNLERE